MNATELWATLKANHPEIQIFDDIEREVFSADEAQWIGDDPVRLIASIEDRRINNGIGAGRGGGPKMVQLEKDCATLFQNAIDIMGDGVKSAVQAERAELSRLNWGSFRGELGLSPSASQEEIRIAINRRKVVNKEELHKAIAFCRQWCGSRLTKAPHDQIYLYALEQIEIVSNILNGTSNSPFEDSKKIKLGLMAAKECGNDERQFAYYLHVIQRYAESSLQ